MYYVVFTKWGSLLSILSNNILVISPFLKLQIKMKLSTSSISCIPLSIHFSLYCSCVPFEAYPLFPGSFYLIIYFFDSRKNSSFLKFSFIPICAYGSLQETDFWTTPRQNFPPKQKKIEFFKTFYCFVRPEVLFFNNKKKSLEIV